MENKKLLLGSHVDMNKKNNFLIGSVNQAISENANTFMFFAGPPQSSMRTDISLINIPEFKNMCQEKNINLDDLLVHLPYVINMANTIKKETFDFSVEFLKKEIDRVLKIGVSLVVLHPGASVGGDKTESLKSLVKGLDLVLEEFKDTNIRIALETMSGKGTEVCTNFDEIKFVIDNVKYNEYVGVCFDTCHLSDSGYDVKNNFSNVLDEFENKIGLKKLWAMHLNDSKNECGAKKDRHENIGHGYLGFESILKIVYEERMSGIPIVLETPYIENLCPYKDEIKMIREKKFYDIKN
jgi:deoxyribonuclease-4